MLRVPFDFVAHAVKPTWRRHFRLPPFRNERERTGHPLCGNVRKIKSLRHPPSGTLYCNQGYYFTYYDCCGTGSAVSNCQSKTWCQDHPTGNCSGYGGGDYCTSGKTYSCTIVQSGAECNACSNGVQPPSG
jgi:hypothetical protein